MIRIEQLRQENERLQEKIAEYQRKELQDIRSYAALSAENISLRQQQHSATNGNGGVVVVDGGGVAAATTVGGDVNNPGGNDDNVDKHSWELARVQQEVDRKEHEKQALTQQIRRLKKDMNRERQKRLRLERIMVSSGMDLDQLLANSSDEDEDGGDDGGNHNRKMAASPSRRPKTYKAKNRNDTAGGGGGDTTRLRYPCPAAGCTYVMAVSSASHDAPVDELGNLSDKRGWPLSMRNNALRMRKHMEEFHPDFPKDQYPPGFSKKFSYATPQIKRPRHSAPAVAVATTTPEDAHAGGGGDGDFAMTTKQV